MMRGVLAYVGRMVYGRWLEAKALPLRASLAGSGQSSVEYAVVMAAFLALIVALGVLWRFFDAGILIEHALYAASHHVGGGNSGAWADVFAY